MALSRSSFEKALERFQSSLQILTATVGVSHAFYADALHQYGDTQLDIGNLAAAETPIREAISSLQDVYKPGHPVQAAARSALGECLLAQGKLVEAEELLVSSVEQLRGRLHYDRRRALQRVIRLYESKGITESVRLYREELAAFERKVRLNEATDG